MLWSSDWSPVTSSMGHKISKYWSLEDKSIYTALQVFGQKPTVWCLCAVITLIVKWHSDYEVKVQNFTWRHFQGMFQTMSYFLNAICWTYWDLIVKWKKKIPPCLPWESTTVESELAWYVCRDSEGDTDSHLKGRCHSSGWWFCLSAWSCVNTAEQMSAIYLTLCLSFCLQFDCLLFLQCDPYSKLAASVETSSYSLLRANLVHQRRLHSRIPDLSQDKWKWCTIFTDLLLSPFTWN